MKLRLLLSVRTGVDDPTSCGRCVFRDTMLMGDTRCDNATFRGWPISTPGNKRHKQCLEAERWANLLDKKELG